MIPLEMPGEAERFTTRKIRFIRITATLVVLALFAIYIASSWQELKGLRIVSPSWLSLLVSSSLVNIYANGRGMDAVLRPFSVYLSVYETLRIASLTRLLNQISPARAGFAVRAKYLKVRHKLTYTRYASSFAASNMVMHGINAGLGILSITALNIWGESLLITFAFLSVFLGIVVLFTLNPVQKLAEKEKRIVYHLKNIVNGWAEIREDKHTLRYAAFWMGITVLMQIILFFASFKTLGVDISFWGAVFIATSTLLSSLVSVTPGEIGIAEALAVASSSAVGIATPVAFAAAIMRRFSGLFISSITLMISARKDLLQFSR